MKLHRIRKLLVANRSEIAIRTVAVYAHDDRFALHRFKADEAYEVGSDREPIQAYLDIDEMLRVARQAGADAVHPGYGFLSENPDFAESCEAAGLIFIGPPPDILRRLGDKVEARALAQKAGVPVLPASGTVPTDETDAAALAESIGYPIMIKASWGGGGRGMRIVREPGELTGELDAARRSGATRCFTRNWLSGRAMWRCKSWATRRARWSTCSSATARSSGATRK